MIHFLWVAEATHTHTQLVTSDLQKCGLEFNEEFIRNCSKQRYKHLIKAKIYTLAHDHLKQNRSSKLSNLTEFKLQNYLSTDKLNLKSKRLLFVLRLRMVPDIRENFKSKFNNNTICPLCFEHSDDQQGLLTCRIILSESNLKEEIRKISYSDIFGTLDQQIGAVQVFEKVLKFRNKKLTHQM